MCYTWESPPQYDGCKLKDQAKTTKFIYCNIKIYYAKYTSHMLGLTLILLLPHLYFSSLHKNAELLTITRDKSVSDILTYICVDSGYTHTHTYIYIYIYSIACHWLYSVINFRLCQLVKTSLEWKILPRHMLDKISYYVDSEQMLWDIVLVVWSYSRQYTL